VLAVEDSASLPSPPAWRCSAARPARGPCVPARRRSQTPARADAATEGFCRPLPGRARGMRHRQQYGAALAAFGLAQQLQDFCQRLLTLRAPLDLSPHLSSLRCPSSAATNRPSTVASSSATSVIWRAAAEFMVDDRGTSLKLNANRCRDTKSRASFHPEYIIPRSLPGRLDAGVSSFRAQHHPRLPALSDGRAGSQRRLRLTRQCRALPRLITHVSIRRRERFLGLTLRLFRTV